jgi:2-keto-4-pentenoate hydratase
MNQSNIELASKELWTLWQAGAVTQALSEAVRPASRLEGYRIQACLEARSAKPLYGWKIAATSTAGQMHIGVDGPMAGRVLAERVVAQDSTVSLTNNRMRVAECEFAFTMKRTLAPQSGLFTQTEVMAAVGSLHPAIEIPDSRYEKFETVGAPQLIADSACAHLFLLGDATTSNWRSFDLSTHAVTASVTQGSTLTHHHGLGSNVLGDPRIALTWLANELRAMGVALQAGQVVTTGTCVVPIPVKAGDQVEVSFGALGSVGVSFAE